MYKELFKNRNFALLTVGGFISSIGDYLYNIGITVFIYTVTKSIEGVALMWLSRAVLRIPVLYMSGIIADYYNRKIVITITNLVSAAIAILFILVDKERLWLAYLLAFLLQSLNDMDVNSETAILPELVSKEQVSYANSVFSFLQSTCVFLSPAIGGILYKFYGAKILFSINALSFLLAGIFFANIRYEYLRKQVSEKRAGIIKGGMEGYRLLSKFSNVKTVFIIMSIFAVLGRFYETYKVAVSDVLLKINPEGIIYFDYALAIGGLAVPIIIKLLSRHNQVIMFTFSTTVISFMYIIFGYSHSFIITFIILIFLGLSQNLQGIYSSTIIQNSIPKEYIGRVFSFYKILLTFFAILGLIIAGPLYNFIGLSSSFAIVSVALMLMCIVQLKSSWNKKHSDLADSI